jgi:hypothetical protein
MVSISKLVGVLSCGFLLCLSLSHATEGGTVASAADEKKADQTDRRQGSQEAGEKPMSDEMKGGQSERGKTIKGEVLRVEGANYFVKGQDGKEVRLHTDSTTQMMTGIIGKGDRVEAKVNDQSHALSINKTSTN